MSHVERLYAEAFAAAERGRALEGDARGSREAIACFESAIRILSRLAIVESAAKRELVNAAIAELRERIARLEVAVVGEGVNGMQVTEESPPVERAGQWEAQATATPGDGGRSETAAEEEADRLLTEAMEVNARAREMEDHGRTAESIELYLSAGDWYMKAYAALESDRTSREAVREQIEFIIDHVSELKAVPNPPPPIALVTEADTHPPPTSTPSDAGDKAAASGADEIIWPAVPVEVSIPQSEAMAPPSQPPAVAVPTYEATTAESAMAGFAWPLAPGVPLSANDIDGFEWPEAPVAAQRRRESKARAPAPSSRSSSSDNLLPPKPQASQPPVATPPPTADGAAVYSAEELDVLRRSSLINGHIFVPWLDHLDGNENFRSVDVFVDPDGMVPLSAKQQKKGAEWMRPRDYAQLCGNPPVMISNICPQAVKQDIVTDCSFVASLCIAAAYEQRFQKRLITNIIFPVDPVSNQPMYNPSGKYVVKLWANGVPRKVVIDDFLPVSKQARQLLCSCTTQANELWVSLIEKAYLKLCGGYDYPGGNSGIDLFALTGWIPERIAITELASDPQQEDRLWEQLKSAFHYGDCIITMTTGDLAKDQAKVIGLVPMHVYAVLNVFETSVTEETTGEPKKVRLLHVQNPWRKLGWKGPYSRSDTKTWTGKVGDELRAYQQQFYTVEAGASTEGSTVDDGLFWIDLESVKIHYDSLYLNWNPALFPHKYVIHEHWPVELGPANDSITLGYNPQYSLRFETRQEAAGSRTSSTVWVLLTRHVSTVERENDSAAPQYLTLHVYRNTNGKRVYYNQDAMYRGTYSNNPHTLVSLDIDFAQDPEPTFTLVASQYEKFAPLDYTLSVFSTTPFQCRPVPHLDAIPHSLVIDGAWDTLSSGGRPFFSTFMENPQYHLHLPPSPGRIQVFLETAGVHSELDPPVNLRAIPHTCDRQGGLPASEQVMSSGEYRPGFCYLEIDAETSQTIQDLVIIPSTFESKVMAGFRIRVLVEPPTAAISCRTLRPEGDGMQAHTFSGSWDSQAGTAVGCASYGCYTFNPKYLVHVKENCELVVRLVPLRGDPSTPLPSANVSVFASNADGHLPLSTNPSTAHRRATSAEGVYVGGNPSGVAIPRGIVFPVGWYVIIPSTYEPEDSTYELRVYSSHAVDIRPWT